MLILWHTDSPFSKTITGGHKGKNLAAEIMWNSENMADPSFSSLVDHLNIWALLWRTFPGGWEQLLCICQWASVVLWVSHTEIILSMCVCVLTDRLTFVQCKVKWFFFCCCCRALTTSCYIFYDSWWWSQSETEVPCVYTDKWKFGRTVGHAWWDEERDTNQQGHDFALLEMLTIYLKTTVIIRWVKRTNINTASWPALTGFSHQIFTVINLVCLNAAGSSDVSWKIFSCHPIRLASVYQHLLISK